MQFGKLGRFFGFKPKNIQQTSIRDEHIVENVNTGPITLTMMVDGQQYYLKYSGNPKYLSNPMTKYLFGQFCISFKDTPFEPPMRQGLLEWAEKTKTPELEKIVNIIYPPQVKQKLVEPLNFHEFNFEK